MITLYFSKKDRYIKKKWITIRDKFWQRRDEGIIGEYSKGACNRREDIWSNY